MLQYSGIRSRDPFISMWMMVGTGMPVTCLMSIGGRLKKRIKCVHA